MPFFASNYITMQKYLATLLILLLINFINAQTGRVSGIIVDSKTGETLPGAQVLVEGSTRGASADFDGKFAINNVPVGKVTLVISYISYTSKKITGVNVLANDVTDVNIRLEPSTSQDLNEVEVVVTLNRENNTALVLQQKNNASVSDGISAETIKRSPDKNTSDVLRRVSGASIQDNKFAIVRGLNDRYNAAYLNGAPLPSTESDRKAFSFDLFPSNMLDNLVITKTARPDLPGEFAGGIIEINTKNIPEKNFLLVSAGTGYNTITTGKERLYYNGGKTDWLGRDDGTRALPSEVPSYKSFPSDINEQAAVAKRMPVSDWGIYNNKKFAPNSSYQVSGGYNFKRKEKDFFGVLGSVSYNSTNNFFTTKRYVYLTLPTVKGETPVLDKNYLDRTFQNEKLIGGLLNASCKLNENNSISFKNLYSIFSDDRVIERNGTTTPLERNQLLVKSTAMWFTQNTALTSQLIGEHYIPKAKIKIGWNANYANVKRDIPNLRRHTYTRLSYLENKNTDPNEPPFYDPTDTIWKAQLTNSGSSGNEYSGVMMWSTLTEKIYNTKLDITHNYKINKDFTLESKIGSLYQLRDRDFDFRQFVYSEYGGSGGATTFSSGLGLLPTTQIFAQQNMGVITPSTSGSGQIGGFKLTETTLPQSAYKAGSTLTAGYLMFDAKYTSKLRLITGVRIENYNQRLSYFDNLYVVNNKIITQDTTILDILPSANFIYSINDKTNLRASYSKTINRPEFRELAPFLFYDFNTQFSLQGNPSLKRALIDNYDLRWEWYPGSGQLISVSGFHKKFENPIELKKEQNATAISYVNVPSAYCQGLEFEARINVGKFYKNDSSGLGKFFDNLTLFSNLSLIKSRIKRGSLNTFDLYDRPMQGQSPYVLNAGISYVDNKNDFSYSVMLNRVGPRIYIVGNDVSAEIWELSRTGLDMQATKSFLKKKLELRLNIKDILARIQPLKNPVNFANKIYNKKSNETASLWTRTFGTTISLQVSYKF
jgi:TonB-dependent receptor